jgi:hypothetical protein
VSTIVLVPVVAVAEQDPGEHRSGAVHPDRGVGPEDELAQRPVEARGSRRAAELGHGAEAPVLRVDPGGVALLERLGERCGAGLGVEHGRVLVRVGEGLGQVLAGQPVHLAQDRLRRLGVDVGEGSLAEDLVALEHLEEVELDVADIALVVAHRPTFSDAGDQCGKLLPASNNQYLSQITPTQAFRSGV